MDALCLPAAFVHSHKLIRSANHIILLCIFRLKIKIMLAHSYPEYYCISFVNLILFVQAAHYFGIRIIHIPVDKKTFQLDLKVCNELFS